MKVIFFLHEFVSALRFGDEIEALFDRRSRRDDADERVDSVRSANWKASSRAFLHACLPLRSFAEYFAAINLSAAGFHAE